MLKKLESISGGIAAQTQYITLYQKTQQKFCEFGIFVKKTGKCRRREFSQNVYIPVTFHFYFRGILIV